MKMDTDAVRAKATAVFTLVNARNDVAMRDHYSLEVKSVSMKTMMCISPTFRVSRCPTGDYEVG